MNFRGLNVFVRNSDALITIQASKFTNRRLGVCVDWWLFQLANKLTQKYLLDDYERPLESELLEFCQGLRSLNAEPLFVFDGITLPTVSYFEVPLYTAITEFATHRTNNPDSVLTVPAQCYYRAPKLALDCLRKLMDKHGISYACAPYKTFSQLNHYKREGSIDFIYGPYAYVFLGEPEVVTNFDFENGYANLLNSVSLFKKLRDYSTVAMDALYLCGSDYTRTHPLISAFNDDNSYLAALAALKSISLSDLLSFPRNEMRKMLLNDHDTILYQLLIDPYLDTKGRFFLKVSDRIRRPLLDRIVQNMQLTDALYGAQFSGKCSVALLTALVTRILRETNIPPTNSFQYEQLFKHLLTVRLYSLGYLAFGLPPSVVFSDIEHRDDVGSQIPEDKDPSIFKVQAPDRLYTMLFSSIRQEMLSKDALDFIESILKLSSLYQDNKASHCVATEVLTRFFHSWGYLADNGDLTAKAPFLKLFAVNPTFFRSGFMLIETLEADILLNNSFMCYRIDRSIFSFVSYDKIRSAVITNLKALLNPDDETVDETIIELIKPGNVRFSHAISVLIHLASLFNHPDVRINDNFALRFYMSESINIHNIYNLLTECTIENIQSICYFVSSVSSDATQTYFEDFSKKLDAFKSRCAVRSFGKFKDIGTCINQHWPFNNVPDLLKHAAKRAITRDRDVVDDAASILYEIFEVNRRPNWFGVLIHHLLLHKDLGVIHNDFELRNDLSKIVSDFDAFLDCAHVFCACSEGYKAFAEHIADARKLINWAAKERKLY